jgi:hypothetical protein
MTKVVDEMDIPDLPPKIELDDGIRFYNYPKNKQEGIRIANGYYYGVSEFWGFGDRAWRRAEETRRSQECYRTYHE